jgi:hypothetical protein
MFIQVIEMSSHQKCLMSGMTASSNPSFLVWNLPDDLPTEAAGGFSIVVDNNIPCAHHTHHSVSSISQS